MPSREKLLEIAMTAAREAAALVRERAAGAVAVAATKSTPTDPVTEADRTAEALIRQSITAQRPDDAFLGEEGGQTPARNGASGVRWIVDPIDGTVNFLYGIARYAVSIAAEIDGVVVAGAVVDVPRGTEYTAVRRLDGSIDARRDGAAIACRPPAPLGKRLVATGFSYDADLRRLQAEAMVRLLPTIRDIRRIGSAALDICGVAEGSVDGYLEEGLHLWDHAAACLVAEGAGARWEATTGIGGRRFVLCAPAHGYAELRAAAAAAGLLAPGATAGNTPD